MENEKIAEEAKEETQPTFRKIIIETDGNRIRIPLNEATGVLELKAILTEILTSLRA